MNLNTLWSKIDIKNVNKIWRTSSVRQKDWSDLTIYIFVSFNAVEVTEFYCSNYGNLLTHLWQKFRESNVFVKEVTRELISRKKFRREFFQCVNQTQNVWKLGWKNPISRKNFFRQINEFIEKVDFTKVLHDSNIFTLWSLPNFCTVEPR